MRQDPGLFDVPEGDFDNNDDAYFMVLDNKLNAEEDSLTQIPQVPSRRDDSRASRGFLHRNERQEEARPHGPKEHSDNAHSWMLDRDGGGSHSRVLPDHINTATRIH